MLEWNTRRVNDLPGNPIECYWAVGEINDSPRLYRIVEQYPADTNGLRTGNQPELYVLFENLKGRKHVNVLAPEEIEVWKYSKYWGNCMFLGGGEYVHAYKTLDEAKARAETQLDRIKWLISEYDV